MHHSRWVCVPFMLLPLLCGGCEEEDLDRLKRAGKKTVENLSEASETARDRVAEGFDSLRTADGLPPVARRVQIRLQADVRLDKAKIVVISNGEAVELRGIVGTRGEKDLAIELARTTTGVGQVVDSLRLEPR